LNALYEGALSAYSVVIKLGIAVSSFRLEVICILLLDQVAVGETLSVSMQAILMRLHRCYVGRHLADPCALEVIAIPRKVCEIHKAVTGFAVVNALLKLCPTG